jgi:hypothetical protein
VLAVEGQDWAGPPDEAYSGELVRADTADQPLSAQDLYQLHAAADNVDMAMLSEPDLIDAFAIVADLGWDGVIEVLVHLTDPEEPSVIGQPWAKDDLVTYEVRWQSPAPEERESRYPTDEFLASRDRVALLVAKTTRAIVEAAGGIVLDEDGFSVDRYTL